MKLEGSLKQFPLRELIEMTVYSSVTGAINIYGDGRKGQIFFRDGQPYHSTYDNLSGLDAVAAMFEDNNARFAFVSDITGDDETLWGDPLDMADNAERLAYRWRKVHPVVPHARLIAIPRVAPESARYKVAPGHWAVYTAIDGRHTLEDLAGLLNWETIEICEAVAQMIADGVVELRERGLPAAAQAGQPGPTSERSARGSLIDRLLATLPPVETAATPTPEAPPAEPGAPKHTSAEESILRLLRQ